MYLFSEEAELQNNTEGGSNDITVGAASAPTSSLKDDILSVLGDEIVVAKQYGQPIHQEISDRWINIVKNGLESGRRNELKVKYPAPENSRIFEAPKLNLVIKQAINDSVIKRDDRLSNKQAQLGASLSAIGMVISELLEKKEGGHDNKNMLERLSDAGRLLADLHHTESVTRKELISLNLNKDWKGILAESLSEEWLFGDNLEERLKDAKSIQQSSNQLKIAKHTVKKVSNKQNLNWTSPLKGTWGAKQSGRFRQAPNSRYKRLSHPQRQEKPRVKYRTERNHRRN